MRTNRNRIVFDTHVVRRYPLQTHDQQDLLVIAHRQEAARRAGLPVPAILSVHEQPPVHLVMERSSGTPVMETELSPTAQHRLGAQLAEFAAHMRTLVDWQAEGPRWATLWEVLALVADNPACDLAAVTAAEVTTTLVHGDLSAGNLLVSTDGDLVAVIDWDGAALADPAMDWSALNANCAPEVVKALRRSTPTAEELDRRAAIYLDTWGTQHDLWEQGRHPWLSGDRPVSEPRL
ncbi:MAG: phosphotransferase [Candidatus Nanopelagicales bacterium]|jgi:aminoglycoside phosphotransferase (APT) family kinase protein|nr:phosphotransferase [Candidatus Nanopelagicales bacterium]